MIKNIGTRAIISTVIFWLGFHLIGFLIWHDGNASFNNIVWRLFQATLNFEIFLLKIALGLTCIGLITLLAHDFYSSKSKQRRQTDEDIAPKLSTPASLNPQSSILPEQIQPASKPTNAVKPVSKNSPSPELSPAELKRRAIKQLTGKEF